MAAARLGSDELRMRRWFAGKARVVRQVEVADAASVPGGGGAVLAVVDVRYGDGGSERYLLPSRGSSLAELPGDDPLWPALAHAMREGSELTGEVGVFRAHAGATAADRPRRGRLLTDDQSNTSVVLDERLVLKCYRRLEQGVHPEQESLEALAGVGCEVVPRWHASLVYRDAGGEAAAAVLYGFVTGAPVGWEPAIAELQEALAGHGRAAALEETAAGLGATTAELHGALGDAFGVAAAAPEAARIALVDALSELEAALATLPEELAARVRPAAVERLRALGRLAGVPLGRVHGDLHLAQFVRSPRGLVAVDFEGEPDQPLAERRASRSPLRDLASLLLSLDHVAAAAARRQGFGAATADAFAWSERARRRVLDAYGPVDEELLRAHEVEKECRELLYAARVLPEWLYAPRVTLPRLLGVDDDAAL